MQRFIRALFYSVIVMAGLNGISIPQAFAYCNAVNNATSGSAVATSTSPTIELASMLSLTNSYSVTTSTNFSGFRLTCVTGGETLNYRNGIEGGYTVKFTTGDQDTFIKFTASLPVASKKFSAIVTQDYASAEFDSEMTINAEVVDGANYDAATTTGNIEIPVLYFISDNGSASYPTASSLRGLVPSKAAASAASFHDLKGFASFNVIFSPVNTTCVIQNQQFSLPSTTLYTLKSGDFSDTRFAVPVSCSGSINSKATKTFNLRAYSNDIVDNANYIIRNAASTSSGIGFQLFNVAADPLRFSAGYDTSSTSLGSLTQGKDLVGSLTALDIGARYKIYDPARVSPGTVVGTIIIYMEYQ